VFQCCNWTPQRAVEEEFRRKNPFLSSFKHLWAYSVVALIAGVLVAVFATDLLLIFIMLVTLLLLPVYTAITSYTTRLRRVSLDGLITYRDNLARSMDSLGSVGQLSWDELGLLTNPNVSHV
jgi:uncharacterized membrane protein YdbT with pleckstrin-like domain